MRYTGRTIVITGASEGIGAELARQLAPEGPRLVLAAMRARRRELVMTSKAKVGLWLKLIAPRIVDGMARAALKRHDSASRT